ncbi:hypothetical protein [Nocardia bovistercoris]|uniref:DUF4254 domain-containing protein n=1 Tax=Nocardia bovistercoris TaxID=2785916 RepID=A0A931IID4_9NOCA|nr:hypothetical protein [Nocardia bovistercoris]MBH0781138.1 hypothetical protein [Nocardia bovistercoris]
MSGSRLGSAPTSTEAAGGDSAEILLSPRELIAAIAGKIQGVSPMVAWARELGDLHASLLPCAPDRRPEGFDPAAVRAEIARIIDIIDSSAVGRLPCIPQARTHTHTLGQVVSTVAETFATAWWTVRHSDDEEVRHHAWTRLGEIREGYAALLADIETKRVQLPTEVIADPSVPASVPASR